MKPDELEARMRAREWFHALRLLPGAWAIVRVDGRSFHRFTEPLEKPFDDRLHSWMCVAAEALLTELHAAYAYTESDEISILLRPEWDLFDRELEKLVSISAAIASATFTHAAGRVAQFDSRVWLGTGVEDVIDYFRWRQADATRCGLNGWAYWTLRRAGRSAGEAEAAITKLDASAKNELLFRHGINFNDLPVWQRRGTGLYWESFERPGRDPRTGAGTVATRRRVKVDESLPMKDEYDRFLRALAGE